MEVPSPWLILSIIIHGIFGSYSENQMNFSARFLTPLSHFYNESLSAHYGILLDTNGTTQVASLINNLMMVASIIGTVIFMPVMDTYGRKYVAVYCRSVCGILVGVFVLFGSYFNSIELFVVGMFFVGIQKAMKIGVLKMYLSECSPNAIRGFTIHAVATMAAVGNIGPGLMALESLLGNDDRWHYVGYIFVFWSLLYLLLAIVIPESPKYMRMKKYPLEDVKKAITRFHGKKANVYEVIEEYDTELTMTNEEHTSFVQILRDPGLRDSLAIAMVAALMCSLSPNQILSVNGIPLFIRYGMSNADALNYSSAMALIMTPLSFVIPYFIEKFGRRPLLFTGMACNIVITILLFAAQLVLDITGSANLLTVVAIVLASFLDILTMKLGVLMFFIIIIADLLPASAKAATTEAALIANCVFNIVMTSAYAAFDSLIGSGIYVPVFALQVYFFWFLYKNFDETKQKPVFENFAQVRSRANSRIEAKMRSRIQTAESMIRSRKTTVEGKPRTRIGTSDGLKYKNYGAVRKSTYG